MGMNSHRYGNARERGAHHEYGDARERGDEVELTDPAEFWEDLYSSGSRSNSDSESVWSGHVNQSLASIVADWKPGRSLDLGSGEGGDVLWLASRGWDATGIDLSATAVARARSAVTEQGLASAQFIVADLGEWADSPATVDGAADPFDLVTASFFQSPVALRRTQILRAAAARVRPGGHLVVVSHAAAPGGSEGQPAQFVTVESELETLDLDLEAWEILVAQVHSREAAQHAETEGQRGIREQACEHQHEHENEHSGRGDGGHPVFDDAVIVARRRT